jgi:hypothetical protein
MSFILNPYVSYGTVAPSGHIIYSSAGTFDFAVPNGVNSICIVCVGAGGAGSSSGSGCGGALAYVNDIAVTPGTIVKVVVGSVGSPYANPSYAYIGSTANIVCRAGGGYNIAILPSQSISPSQETLRVGAGGMGGYGRRSTNTNAAAAWLRGGAGGAGGYTGNGGDGGYNPSSTGVAADFIAPTGGQGGGGAGGGARSGTGGSTTVGAGGGGGVGLFGVGANGVVNPGYLVGGGGGGGSASTGTGGNGDNGSSNGSAGAAGGWPGGGGGYGTGNTSGSGAIGAVRIIWGTGKSFPSNAVI